jgi:hypothetical protein
MGGGAGNSPRPLVRRDRVEHRGIVTAVGRRSSEAASLLLVGACLWAADSVAHTGPSAVTYEVTAAGDAAELHVEAVMPAGVGATFTVDPQAVPFVDEVVAERLKGSESLAVSSAGSWTVAGCERTGCRIRYVFHLKAAAQAIGDPDTAAIRGAALVAPVSTWLLRPQPLPAQVLDGILHVVVAGPTSFVTGLPPVRDMPGKYRVALLPFFVSPYAAFGSFLRERHRVGGADLELAIEAPHLAGDVPHLRAWLLNAAAAVTSYFGRFPVDNALLLVVPQPAGLHGKAMGGGGAAVLIQTAPSIDLTDSPVDWQATHEMVHLAVPELPQEQIWLTEGLATYVEPLARNAIGEMSPEAVWGGLAWGLPKGEPESGDRGLDRTHTWGRTYWGGALFAFLADLEIRKATHGDRSLATALRGVLADGGDARVFWPMARFVSACDRAIGQPVVSRLYRQMSDRAVPIDLPALWRDLGVTVAGRDVSFDVSFDDRAPLATIRRGMTTVKPNAPPHRPN